MRALIVLNSYEEDGPGHLVYRLCQRWVPMDNLRVATVALSRGGPMMDRFRELGVSAEVIPTRGRGGLGRLREWAARLRRRPECPDVIHTHLLWPDVAMRFVARELASIPLVSTCHGLHALDEKGKLLGLAYRMIERPTRKRCVAWVAVSDHVRRSLLETGYDPGRVHLIPNGVDCVQIYPLSDHRRRQLRATMNAPEDAPVIVGAGRLREIKSWDVLIRAMPSIVQRFPETRLFLFGNGPLREPLLQLSRQLGVHQNIHVIGNLSALLPQVLSAADVVVHPSSFESFGLVVAEAAAAGTPVIATRVGGLPEVVRDGVTGFLVDPGSPEQIADRVKQLLEDSGRREEMGRNAREFINDHFELGQTAERYVDLWRSISHHEHERPGSTTEEVEISQAMDTREFQLPK